MDFSSLETKGLNRDGRLNELLRRKKMRYWHLISNPISKFVVNNPFILRLLIKSKIVADGRPGKQIRFNWKKV
jgi:hypothetical protein